MGPYTIKFMLQATFAVCAIPVVAFIPPPYGPTLSLLVLVFGLWIGRQVFEFIVAKDGGRKDRPRRPGDAP